jgi:hypothetical protein
VRVAALYDVHGNLPAREAVLADPRVAAADIVVSGGRPYEGRAAAFWLLMEHGEPELAGTDYEVDLAVERIRNRGYDEADDMVGSLLQPHRADDAMTFFEVVRRGA